MVIMKDFLRKTWKNQKKFVNLPAEKCKIGSYGNNENIYTRRLG